ncbi:hypothetical protein SAMN05421677_1134 [Halobacillus aidingensis]|uniref:Uncharacterized protein n=1 Tax=Halobacillus aidingensis TaxID=240303 RepID=A0A1H0QH02_HALAD|nr:hypothetical protein SAMN05421677_1134 [Halobacillus aidingensis]
MLIFVWRESQGVNIFLQVHPFISYLYIFRYGYLYCKFVFLPAKRFQLACIHFSFVRFRCDQNHPCASNAKEPTFLMEEQVLSFLTYSIHLHISVRVCRSQARHHY